MFFLTLKQKGFISIWNASKTTVFLKQTREHKANISNLKTAANGKYIVQPLME